MGTVVLVFEHVFSPLHPTMTKTICYIALPLLNGLANNRYTRSNNNFTNYVLTMSETEVKSNVCAGLLQPV